MRGSPKRWHLVFFLLVIVAVGGFWLLPEPPARPGKHKDADSRQTEASSGEGVVASHEPMAAQADAPHGDLPPPDRSTAEHGAVGLHADASTSEIASYRHPEPGARGRWAGFQTKLRHATPADDDGKYRQVTILEGAGFAYPVRLEETVRIDPATGTREVVESREMVADRLIVKLRPGRELGELDQHARLLGGKVLRAIDTNLYVIQMPMSSIDELPMALTSLNALPDQVLYAEPDFILYATAEPNDPSYLDGSLWGQHNTGQNGGVADADADMPEGWDIRTEAPNVVVAVIDTGIRYTHEDLAANMWRNPNEIAGNGIDDDNNGYIDDVFGIDAITDSGDPDDDNGHGTHCAGTIGAVGNNGVGVAGVAWNVQLMALKFLNDKGRGATSDAVECMTYARNHGAHITSNSFGGAGGAQANEDAIESLRRQGIIAVVAAGNDRKDLDRNKTYPASIELDNVVTVASSTRKDELSGFSNYGAFSVDLAAPGSEILSTFHTSDSAYQSLNGTSMATPMVSGVVALLLAEFPNDDYPKTIRRLYGSVDPVPAYAGRVSTEGRVNLANALDPNRVVPNEILSVTTGLEDSKVAEGSMVTLTVVAKGSGTLQYTWFHNGVVLPDERSSTLVLDNISMAQAGDYRVRISADNAIGAGSTATINVLAANALLGDALDAPEYTWVTYGSSSTWVSQANLTHDGVDAAATPQVSDNEHVTLQTTVTGPGVVSFWAKVSSEHTDLLGFLVGEDTTVFSGEKDWFQHSVELPAGEHTLQWIYEKDAKNSRGRDAAYIDEFSFVADGVVAPKIIAQPESLTVAPSTTATFTVNVVGTDPLTYQWLKDDNPLVGETMSTLTLDNVDVANEGSYTVEVTNGGGTTTSTVARLTVDAAQPPRITKQPVSQAVNTGTTVVYTVEVAGTSPFSYQWRKDDVDVPGETGPTLTFANVSLADGGFYTVVVSNAVGSVTSNVAALAVADLNVAPGIVKSPVDQTVIVGDTAVFTVEVIGDEPLTYSWYKNGEIIDATERTLTIANTQVGDAGRYHVVARNSFGTATSSTATLSVLLSTPDLANALDNAVLNFSTDGDAPWFLQTAVTQDGVDALQSAPVGASQDTTLRTTVDGPGVLSFFWKVSSERGYDVLEVRINDERQDDISGEVDWEQKSLTVGDGVHDVVWRFSRDFTGDSGSDAGWVDQVLFTPGSIDPPVITMQPEPASALLAVGDAVVFRVAANGPPPITYQWRKDGAMIVGATAAEFSIDMAAVEDSGSYDVVVTNPNGSVTSRTSMLTVSTDPIGLVLDLPGANWSTGGDSAWIVQTEVTFDGVDALQSGPISHDETSVVDLVLNGPTSVSFQWKVSSEHGYDELRLELDGTSVVGITGELDWTGEIVAVPAGEHTLSWVYAKDNVGSAGLDRGWLDMVADIGLLAGANAGLETDGRSWLSAGNAAWESIQNAAFTDGDGMVSALIGHNQVSDIVLHATGPAVLHFDWAVSSEEGFDFLRFIDNGNLQRQISGEQSLTTVTYFLEAGDHELVWRYAKDNEGTAGTDSAFLDFVELLDPAQIPLVIVDQPSTTDAMDGGPVTLSVFAVGSGPLTYQWRRNGEDLVGQTSATLNIAAVTTNDAGNYTVVVTNATASQSATSAVATVTVLTATELGDAVGFTDPTWTSSGDRLWEVQSQQVFDGPTALASGLVDHNQMSTLSLTVTGPAICNFWWKVSSEEGFDFLDFSINGERIASLTGDVDWVEDRGVLGDGEHVLSWTYVKDEIGSVGFDAGFLDQVNITATNVGRPLISQRPLATAAALNTAASFSVTAVGEEPLSYQWRFNDVDLPGETSNQLNIAAVTAGDVGNYSVVVTNAAGTVTSQPVALLLYDPVPLAEAVDAEQFAFESDGEAVWFSQTQTTHDGVSALQSGDIGDGEETILRTTISGPGTLSFWWRVSSEGSYDFLSFWVDGQMVSEISGEYDWEQFSVVLADGAHELAWVYAKDNAESVGSDAGWVDEVVLSNDVDGDGMADDWERLHFGDLSATADADVDRDGASNLEEFQDGTDPNVYVLVLVPGWNLVSLSGRPVDRSVAALFAGTAISQVVWCWTGERYEQADELRPLRGYWVYNPTTSAISVIIDMPAP